ncbi:DUF2807 domain-containing protein [Duganella fentianensis]|uniref:GIN domain-containing protein n=1 Tax=Duganella fentianensis TaxID=2692177 RepID=UPI0032B14544
MRKAISLAVLAACASLAGCAIVVIPDDGGNARVTSVFGSSGVQGNGQTVVEQRPAVDADSIDINGPLQVEIKVGNATGLQVEGDSNLLPMVRTDASGGLLRVWVDGKVNSSNALRVTYTTPALRQIQSNGSGRLIVTGLNGGALTLSQNGSRQVQLAGHVSRLEARLNGSGSVTAAGLQSGSTTASLHGSGKLDLGRVDGERLELDVRGSGGVHASGMVRNMNVRVYGSGSASLAGLQSQNAELVTYGSGSITAAVSQSLVATSNGSGYVTVYGNPVQRNVSGRNITLMQ